MKLAAALLTAAVATPTAAAALEVRLAVTPATPRAGRTATITLRTYTPLLRADGTCCLLQPTSVDYPFRVEAESPRGRVYRIRVRRTSDPYVYLGKFTFRTAGRWHVRVTNAPRCQHAPGARPCLRVRVAPSR